MQYAEQNENITGAELSNVLGVCRSVISQWTKEGCPCVYYGRVATPKRGTRPRYNVSDIKAWLASRNKQTAKEGVTA